MLEVEKIGSVLHLTLNRPSVRNAFNEELIDELTLAYKDIAPQCRVVILRGKGPAFCAGGDLEWMQRAARYTEEQNAADALKLAQLFQTISDCPAATIAVAHGSVFGGGCGLIAASDIAIGDGLTKFAFSEVKLGLIPATISPFVMRKIGYGAAKWLFATGEVFNAETALRIGLINESVDSTLLEEAIERKIRSVLASGPEAVTKAKRLVDDGVLSLAEVASRLAQTRASAEAKEGIGAFLEKRKPNFVQEYP